MHLPSGKTHHSSIFIPQSVQFICCPPPHIGNRAVVGDSPHRSRSRSLSLLSLSVPLCTLVSPLVWIVWETPISRNYALCGRKGIFFGIAVKSHFAFLIADEGVYLPSFGIWLAGLDLKCCGCDRGGHLASLSFLISSGDALRHDARRRFDLSGWRVVSHPKDERTLCICCPSLGAEGLRG